MFVVLLKFAENKDQMSNHLEAHKAWLQQGFDEGVFCLAGSLEPGMGGGILTNPVDRDALLDRIQSDPFVEAGVVMAEVIEIAASKTDERLAFLQG